VPIQQPI
jgi:hypothetical protein